MLRFYKGSDSFFLTGLSNTLSMRNKEDNMHNFSMIKKEEALAL